MQDFGAKIQSRLKKNMPELTVGRVMVAAYVTLILVVAFLFVPGRDGNKHYLARRYMGANTRLSANLLIEPPGVSLEDRLWLDREKSRLVNKYLKTPVEELKPITPDNTQPWPNIKPEKEAAVVELEPQPDWAFLNQGSTVQVWLGNNPKPERAEVLTIVPSGTPSNKWLVFLRKQDLPAESFINSKDKPMVRLEVVPGKPADAAKDPSPTPVGTPAGGEKPLDTQKSPEQKQP